MERYVNCSGLIYHGQEPRTTTIDKPRFKSLLCWVSHRSKEIVYIPSCARISLLSTSQTFIFLLFVPELNTSRSFPHSWLITGFVTRLARRVSPVEREILTLPEHLSSPPVLSGVRVTRSLALCFCFVDRCLSFCTFSLGHCVVWSSAISSDYHFGIFKLFLALLHLL